MILQNSNKLYIEDEIISISELIKFFEKKVEEINLDKKTRICVISNNQKLLIAAAIYFYANKFDGIITTDQGYLDKDLSTTLIFKNTTLKEIRKSSYISSSPERISIFTSGSTSKPKLVEYSWDALASMSNLILSKKRWLVTYNPGTYAWFQMVTLFMFSKDQSLIIENENNPYKLIEEAIKNNCTSVSATPSFWRFCFITFSKKILINLKLNQITLGGEIVDQQILNQIKEYYPNTVITQIYATSEVGVILISKDGYAGFPVEELIKNKEIKLVNNELYVKANHKKEEFIATGDYARIEKNRLYILGRLKTDFINIGGHKISIKSLEETILKHKKVLDCRVYSKSDKLCGNILLAEIVIKDNFTDYEKNLTQYCQQELKSEWMIPRKWYRKDRIELNTNFKKNGK